MEDEPEVYASGDGTGRHPDQAFCLCGSAWFRVAAAIEPDGNINGYTGPIECIECGETYPLGWTGSINDDGTYFDPGASSSS